MQLMGQRKTRGYENCILAFAVMGAGALLMGFFFDFYFDMNDDTMMRDIMSGIYSGTPDGHNMQTLYPLGALIALCYRIYGAFPWYGAFLFLCQFGCFFLVGVRLCTLADTFFDQKQAVSAGASTGDGGIYPRFAGKLLCLLTMTAFQWGIWLTHTVNVQYTITSGMLVGAAVFLFLTMQEGEVSGKGYKTLPVKVFLLGSLPSLLLFLLAFHLRSEMALLTLPFLGLAGLLGWWTDRPVSEGNNLRKYGGLLFLLLAGMGLSIGADSLAYGGEWRTFRQFFDDRTTIYDFYPEVISKQSSDAELEALGVSYGAQILLDNYNFGLDERIDAQMLSDVAAYAKEHVDGTRDWSADFKEKLLHYRYRSFHSGDAPYNFLVIFGYGTNLISAVILLRRDRRHLAGAGAQLFLILAVRSALWLFVLMRGRDPERITHPLYLVEFSLLMGMFWWQLRHSRASSEAGRLLCGAAAVLLLLSSWGLWKGLPAVRADQTKRQKQNGDWEAIDAYCRAHPDTFYLEDVYSTVAFSGKLLERRENTLANYDIAGGWMCKSPLYREKLAAFDIEEAGEALAQGNADFIMSDEEEGLRGLLWLAVFYAENGMDVLIEEYDRIGEEYGVYQVIPVSAEGQYLREIKGEQ